MKGDKIMWTKKTLAILISLSLLACSLIACSSADSGGADTTAAGDTFTGFFLASYLKDGDVKKALDLAAKASSITVQGKGAAQSIPEISQL